MQVVQDQQRGDHLVGGELVDDVGAGELGDPGQPRSVELDETADQFLGLDVGRRPGQFGEQLLDAGAGLLYFGPTPSAL